MKRTLKEHFKHLLLKEEIDYQKKTATVYHLTGHKLHQYDPTFVRKSGMKPSDLEREFEKKYADKPQTRANKILQSVGTSKAKEALSKFKTKAGKAYHAAQLIQQDPYSLGSNFFAGRGALYGPGLYTCYEFNPKIASIYGDVILRFEVDISNFLILNVKIAKEIYGENYKVEDQVIQALRKKGIDIDDLSSTEFYDPMIGALYDLQRIDRHERVIKSEFKSNSRTGPQALSALQNFSRQFDNGTVLKIRDFMDGIIFFGQTDGPVCVIYEPETSNKYQLTGAGYFKNNGDPYITGDIESLVGSKGADLSDTFEFNVQRDETQNFDQKRTKVLNKILFNIDDDEADSDIEKMTKELVLKQIDTRIMEPIMENLGFHMYKHFVQMMKPRLLKTKELPNSLKQIQSVLKHINHTPSLLLSPVIKFAEAYSGKSMQVITEDELTELALILAKIIEFGRDPILKDFEGKNITLSAQTQEELDSINSQHFADIKEEVNTNINQKLPQNLTESLYTLQGYGGSPAQAHPSTQINPSYFSLNTQDDLGITLQPVQEFLKPYNEQLQQILSQQKQDSPKSHAQTIKYIQDERSYIIDVDTMEIDSQTIVNSITEYSSTFSPTAYIIYHLAQNADFIENPDLEIQSQTFANIASTLYLDHYSYDSSSMYSIFSYIINIKYTQSLPQIPSTQNIQQIVFEDKVKNLMDSVEEQLESTIFLRDELSNEILI